MRGHGLLPDFLLTLLCLFLPRAGVFGSHAALLCRGKALITCLLQDGKTAEDLAKSEQHEHVAGLLARLRKVSLHLKFLTSFCVRSSWCFVVDYQKEALGLGLGRASVLVL